MLDDEQSRAKVRAMFDVLGWSEDWDDPAMDVYDADDQATERPQRF